MGRMWVGGALIGSICVAFMVTAGPLNPPAGPLGSTYKTLSDIEPRIAVQSLSGDSTALYVISQPGSYYLTGNITGTAGKGGIKVAASNVAIDLRGFLMDGAGIGADAIAVSGTVAHLTVRQGNLANWLGKGVAASTCTGCRMESLLVRGSGAGLDLGDDSTVSRCIGLALGNAAPGIRIGVASRVQECLVLRGAAAGISLGAGYQRSSVAQYCIANGMTAGDGIQGLGYPYGSIRGCTTRGNASDGVRGGGIVEDSTATQNGGNGVDQANTAVGCTASRNTLVGFAYAGTIDGCTATGNGQEGVANSYAIRWSTCVANGLSGIRVQGTNINLEGNLTNANGGAGITMHRELTYQSSIVQNVSSGNTGVPYDIGFAASNGGYFGQFIANPASGFVTTDPWANFSF